MANLINTEAITKTYGERTLLRDVSLGVQDGDRIGVVGLNGSGKTTLLEILAGVEPPDDGRVSRARDLRLAVVTQRTETGAGTTVADAVLAGYAAEHEWAADPRVRSIVTGLGIDRLGFDSDVGRLSGGERRRVALAEALVAELDVVVLDEPTNHLDVEGIGWLADHLLARKVALVVVTHDRWFLDTVCSRTWEVVDGSVEQYEGGYADWVYARAERARIAQATEEKRRNLARKELAWLHRGAKARTTKPKYRVEAAEALIADVPQPRDTVELHAFARRRLGKTVIELEDVTLTAGATLVLDRVTWRLGPGERIGIVGVNGSGKTTLLRLLAGAAEPDSGRRVQGSTVRLAYLAQQLEDLPGERRVLEAVEDVARRVALGRQEFTASQLAERFGFGSSRQWTRIADLSGGERRRLQLARLLMTEPNVLLLDEPTNDLDIDTLQQLEDVLDSWPGTLVVVSHDRYLTERVCDSVYALSGHGSITHLPGGIDEYLTTRARTAERTQQGGNSPDLEQGAVPTAAQQRATRKELTKLERQLDTLTHREKRLHEELAQAATDPERLMELHGTLKEVRAEREELEARWLELAEYLE
ncbi:ABC-F family ATP-binding cassette domain-containing protein [Haloechinothrix sp. LS1_15]|uniref:ABC-F family ATP-binding cassette domain-containing protein n=1 Tax=Haloechinothrix sp. LS1_15 TaxID=2652248 RepID=UPI002945F2BD|nr:ABC-F family ATP-binding cassette domain-containing protein [Haloechinothrix sp. LS1_15]MDV6011480.1 ABC-F family ATP-binding cassette domain-containing protein [Haloechinothrix sp. LS1_15]